MSWVTDNSLNWFQSLILKILKTGQVPKHVALIMDGNRRYANKQNITKEKGHLRGYVSLQRVCECASSLCLPYILCFICNRFDQMSKMLNWCMHFGITEVTVYAFSIENFNRTKKEVDDLMNLAREKFKKLLEERYDVLNWTLHCNTILNLVSSNFQRKIDGHWTVHSCYWQFVITSRRFM